MLSAKLSLGHIFYCYNLNVLERVIWIFIISMLYFSSISLSLIDMTSIFKVGFLLTIYSWSCFLFHSGNLCFSSHIVEFLKNWFFSRQLMFGVNIGIILLTVCVTVPYLLPLFFVLFASHNFIFCDYLRLLFTFLSFLSISIILLILLL